MFLHSGAGLHGHEYSKRPSPTNAPPNHRRNTLLRSALAGPVSRSNTASPNTRPPLTPRPERSLTEPTIPSRDRSTPEPVVRFQEPCVVEPARPHRPVVEVPVHHQPEPMTEDEASHSAAESSYLSDTAAAPRPRRRPRARVPRKSTSYLFAYPAPKPRNKKQLLRIRPRLLLQLQLISQNQRPKPTIDVFPSSLITGNVVAPRFSKRFPRIFGVKGELGLHDTILVRSEDYDRKTLHDDSDTDEDDLESRDLVAVFSPRRGKHEDGTEIVLQDGSVWVATPLANGGYDFVNVDHHGKVTVARWARRAVKVGGGSTGASTPSSELLHSLLDSPDVGPKFTFSIINPELRRHPIMGTLTSHGLEILDNYTTVSQSSARYPPSRPLNRALASGPPTPTVVGHYCPSPSSETCPQSDDETEQITTPVSPIRERTVNPVSDALKNLIAITAIFVSLQHNQSVTHPSKPATHTHEHPPKPTASPLSACPNRSGSFRGRSSRTGGSETPELSIHSTADSTESPRRASFILRKGVTAPLSNASSRDTRDVSPAPSLAKSFKPSLPRRATSTGAAFIHRRIQAATHMSDVSDSEKPLGGIRGRGRRILSGDFGSHARRRSATPSGGAISPYRRDGDGSSGPSDPLHFQQPVTSSDVLASAFPQIDANTKPVANPNVAHAEALARVGGRRRVQSAFYAHPVDHQLGGLSMPGSYDEDDARQPVPLPVEADFGLHGEKGDKGWRRVSNWFRKFGAN